MWTSSQGRTLRSRVTVYRPYILIYYYYNSCYVANLIQYYAKPLSRLINSSFENGLFPDELKIAKVIPIFKNGDKKRYSKL